VPKRVTNKDDFQKTYYTGLLFVFYEEVFPRMPSSGMLHHVALVRTDVSEELRASIIRVTKIGELGMLTVISNQCTL
jgi:hypothetical protein